MIVSLNHKCLHISKSDCTAQFDKGIHVKLWHLWYDEVDPALKFYELNLYIYFFLFMDYDFLPSLRSFIYQEWP